MSWTITGSEKFQPTVGQDQFISNVSLLLYGNGPNGSQTIIDSSPSPKTVTAVGNAQISTEIADPFGNSTRGVLAFDSAGDTLTVPANTAFNGLTQDITYECWLKLRTTSASNAVFSIGGSTAYYQLLVRSGVININSSPNGVSSFFDYKANQSLDTNWHHIAVTKSGSTWRIFYDGNNINATGTTPSIIANNALYIGSNYAVGTTGVDGYIGEFRITSGIARYTANFTPPTAPFPDI